MPNQDGCVLIYDSPERIIAAAAAVGSTIYTSAILEGYQNLLASAEITKQPLISGWRLQRLGADNLKQWLHNRGHTCEIGQTPPMAPLVASVVTSMLATTPQLLDAFTNLELKSELFGGQSDLHYHQRLEQTVKAADPLPQLLTALQNRESICDEISGNANVIAIAQQGLHDEIEKLVFANRQQSEMLDALKKECLDLHHQLHVNTSSLQNQLQAKEIELHILREEHITAISKAQNAQQEIDRLIMADREQKEIFASRVQEYSHQHEQLECQLAISAKTLEEQSKLADIQLHQLREQADEAEREIARLEKQIKQLVEAASTQQQTLEKRILDCLGLRQQLQEQKLTYEEQSHLKEAQLLAARDETATAAIKLLNADQEIERLLTAAYLYQQTLEERTLESIDLQQQLQCQISALESELQITASSLLALQAEAQEKSSRLDCVQEQLDMLLTEDKQRQNLLDERTEEFILTEKRQIGRAHV